MDQIINHPETPTDPETMWSIIFIGLSIWAGIYIYNTIRHKIAMRRIWEEGFKARKEAAEKEIADANSSPS